MASTSSMGTLARNRSLLYSHSCIVPCRSVSSSSRISASITSTSPAIPTYADPAPLVRANLDPTTRAPLKRTHGIHVATLYLAAHHTHNLDLYSRFAAQSARSLGIPTTNPVNLPRTQELHTVLRGPFVHKKYQENFERRTHRRAIKVFDANREVVDLWLRYLKRNGIGGVGMRARVYEFAEFGFGRKEVEGLEKQFESTGGGEEAIREAANELIKALSEPERGKEEKQEHERMLQQEESGGSETKVVSPSSEVSASEIPQMGAIGQSEPTGSQGSPAAEPTISPSAPIESSETAEALNVESESDAKQFIPDRTELAASSKSREGSAVASQSHAALQGSDASSPLPSVSTPPVEHASTEATAAVTIKPAALAPPASTETMGESTALTDALESETEVETTEGELSVGRTPERPAEPATSADISAEVAKAPDLEGTAGTRTPDNSSLTTSTTPTGGHETEAAGTVPSPSSARAAETTETAPAQLEVAVEKSDAVSTHEVDKPDNKK